MPHNSMKNEEVVAVPTHGAKLRRFLTPNSLWVDMKRPSLNPLNQWDEKFLAETQNIFNSKQEARPYGFDPMNDKLWNTEEVAEYLGVKPDTIRTWQSQRKIPFVKVGRTTRYRKQQIDQWVEEQNVSVF